MISDTRNIIEKESFILYYDIPDRNNTVPRLKSRGILPIAVIKIYRAVIVNILSCTLYNEYVTSHWTDRYILEKIFSTMRDCVLC